MWADDDDWAPVSSQFADKLASGLEDNQPPFGDLVFSSKTKPLHMAVDVGRGYNPLPGGRLLSGPGTCSLCRPTHSSTESTNQPSVLTA